MINKGKPMQRQAIVPSRFTLGLWVVAALMFLLAPVSTAFACPSNAITITSSVYGYTAGLLQNSTPCAFKTLEEAEQFARGDRPVSAPLMSLAFPVPGNLDLPNQAGSGNAYLDYRPYGANSLDNISPILFGPPATSQTSYSLFVKGWSTTPVPTQCQVANCTGTSCTTMADVGNLAQCLFDTTWGVSTAHPEFCWARQGPAVVASNFTVAPVISGAGNQSGALTYSPSSSTANNSGASVTIAATACNGNSSIVNVDPTAAKNEASGTTTVSATASSTSLTSAWGGSQQSNIQCGGGSIVNRDASGLGNACNAPLQKLTITPPSQQNTGGQCGVGNPCFPANGNKQAIERGFKYGEIPFDLFYNSIRQTRPYSYIDANWSHTYAKRILTEWVGPNHLHTPDDTNTSIQRITFQDEEAHVETFLATPAGSSSGVYRSTNTLGRVLRWNPAVGTSPPFWELYYPDGTLNLFDRAGRLLQIIYPDDPRKTLTLTYGAPLDCPNGLAQYSSGTIPCAHLGEPFWRVKTVADGTGRSITFNYSADQFYWLTSIVADDNVTTLMSFDYTNTDNVHRLRKTTQFGQSRQYIYNEPVNLPASLASVRGYWLTGILDELGLRYATYQYDSWGRVTASWHGGNANAGKVSISYPSDVNGNPDDSTAVATLPSGVTQTYSYPSNEPYRHASSITEKVGSVTTGTTQYTYDDSNGANSTYRVLSKIDANGNITKYEYDSAFAHRTAIVEAFGTTEQRRTESDWDAGTNRITGKRIFHYVNGVATLETQSTFAYDISTGHLLSRCDYDPAIKTPSAYTCANATNAPSGVRQWTYAYCTSVSAGCPAIGLLQKVNGPRLTTDAGMNGVDDVTTYTYYPSGDLSQVTDALGHITKYLTYDAWGHILRIQDANGTYSDMTYDPRGWLLTRKIRVNADGSENLALDAVTKFDYFATGDLQQVTQPDQSYLKYNYDNAHRLVTIKDKPGQDDLGDTIDYCPGGTGSARCLDSAGNRLAEQVQDPDGGIGRVLTRQYDQLNHFTAVLNAAGAPVQTYTNPSGAPSTYTNGYDANGNAVYSVDGSQGVGTLQQYDPLNRLKATLQDHGGITLQTKDTLTQYAYDARDHLLSVTDPDGLPTLYTYDGLGNLTKLVSPDTGTTNYVSYDASGNLKSKQDAKNVITNYTYDSLNRLTAVSYPATTSLNIAYTYDQPGTGCYNVGRLTKIADSTGNTTYCYDRRGNVLSKTQTTVETYSCGSADAGCGGGSSSSSAANALAKTLPGSNPTLTSNAILTTTYTYTLADRLASITYPSGAIVTYLRDQVGRVNAVKYQVNATAAQVNVLSGVAYYPFGPANVLNFGNGRRLSKGYDLDYAIRSISSSDSAQGLQISANVVDVLGNLQIANTGGSSPAQHYAYDPLYRLKAVTDDGGNTLEAFTYGKTGDRMTKTLQGQPTQTYSYTLGTTHRVASVGGVARTYDPNGNTLTGPANLSYDDRNRLSGWNLIGGQINLSGYSALYGYSGKGERVSKQAMQLVTCNPPSCNPLPGVPTGWLTGTEAFTYDEGGRLIGEYSGRYGPGGAAEYIYLDGIPVAVAQGGTLYYIETDQLGTPRRVVRPGATTAADTVVWKWDYFANNSAFGENAPSLQTIAFNLRFPGQYYDVETGLNYNYFRDYEPGTGRYVESDPIGLGGGTNTYGYVSGNPLAWSDPLGLVQHVTGKTIECGAGCWIRIDYTLSPTTNLPVRHLHWGCRGDEGECGEFGSGSHGGTWDDAPNRIKECALRAGFQGQSQPTPDVNQGFQPPMPDPDPTRRRDPNAPGYSPPSPSPGGGLFIIILGFLLFLRDA